MKIITILYFTAFVLLVSCNVEERVIDNIEEKTPVFVLRESQPEQLGLVNLPSGNLVSEDIYFAKNNEKLPGPITNVVSYRDQLYIFIGASSRIVIVHPDTYKKIKDIDFTEDSLQPADICFPNSTDAYITFSNKPVVYLLDITNNTIARKIDINGAATDIDCAGNQIFAVNPDKNTVSVIDSRTHKQEAVITTMPVPSYLGISFDGKYAFVVSVGYGKKDSQPKSAAMLSIIDVTTRQVTKTFEIGSAAYSATEEEPVGISVATDRVLFVATRETFYRMDYKIATSLLRVRKDKYMSVEYNSKKNQLIFLISDANERKAIIADPQTGAYSKTATLLPDVTKIFSL